MSIYSGFATRNQENYYDQILYNVISTLLVRISKFYQNESVSEQSFLKIISNQERCLRKLQKRKYLQPKYAQLLEHFLGSFAEEEIHQRKQQPYHMNRTLSVLDKQFRDLRDANQKVPNVDRGDAHSLTKIEEKVKRKRRSKSKKTSIKSNLDVWQFKAEKKPPQLPSLQPLQQTLMTKSKFNTRMNFSELPSKDISDYDDDSIKQKGQRKALMKPPKFRAKMFFKEKEVH